MGREFSRSLLAQAAALSVVNAAKEGGWIDGPLAVDPVLAESEKALFLKMFDRLATRRRQGEALSADEVSSLFTFVFARAAEAVTNLVNRQPDDFDMMGMFDGKVPIYADDKLTGYFKTLSFPTDCARAYWEWFHREAEGGAMCGVDPALPLFEALKWCFRISSHLAVRKLESLGIHF